MNQQEVLQVHLCGLGGAKFIRKTSVLETQPLLYRSDVIDIALLVPFLKDLLPEAVST